MPKTYVDNAMNRSLGRVGMAHGTAVHSRSGNSSSSYSSSSSSTYVDNSFNRSLGRVGLPHGTAVHSSSGSSDYSNKTYVDNPLNRSLGRVGLAHGTAVHSSSASSKTYVDNALNRQLDRVGLPHGTAVHSRSCDTNSTRDSGSKTYVDNELNKRLERVGLPHGTAVHSRGDSSLVSKLDGLSLKNKRVYKDNALNRKLGRAGKPIGQIPQQDQRKVYVDNYYNRKHNRVGKPLGSVPISKKTEVYKDTPVNRMLGRVGLPWGSDPRKYNAELLEKLREIPKDEELPEEFLEQYQNESAQDFIQSYFELLNREKQIRQLIEEGMIEAWDAHQHTSKKVLDKYKGNIINFKDLNLKEKIGHGGFGDVHFAELPDGEVVAVKLLRNQKVSKKRQKMFEDEIKLFCKLDHPNIVRFVGACIEVPNLAIVMEYMDISLYEALHIKGVDFTEVEKLSIKRDVTRGLAYLHVKELAHCDLKTHNILLNNIPGEVTNVSSEPIVAKITDFGLSLMKSDTETTASNIGVCNLGTPRYSAPEVLQGEMLSFEDLKKTDIYSCGLIILELLQEEIAFENMTLRQLQKQVGEKGLKPKVKSNLLDPRLEAILNKCWSTNPDERPTADSLLNFFEKCSKLFVEN